MFDATSQSDARPDAQIGARSGTLADGRAEIAFTGNGGQKDGKARLVHLYNRDPLRFLFPTPSAGDCLQAGLVTTSGGLVGGDRLAIDIKVHERASVLVSPTAAEKIYRSAGATCEFDVTLSAASGSWLEWLPQETILFDESRLHRVTRIDVDDDARILAGEILVFGRIGRGERLTRGLVRECWEVRRDGALIWADALHLDGDIAATIDHPAGFDGAAAAATIIYAAPDSEARLTDARAALEETEDLSELKSGVTAVNGLLVARFIGRDARILRNAFGAFWATFRNRVAGLPPALPRLWHV
jgi:urease accessory protein